MLAQALAASMEDEVEIVASSSAAISGGSRPGSVAEVISQDTDASMPALSQVRSAREPHLPAAAWLLCSFACASGEQQAGGAGICATARACRCAESALVLRAATSSPFCPLPAADAPGVVRVQIRLPASRVLRRFEPSTTVGELYLLVAHLLTQASGDSLPPNFDVFHGFPPQSLAAVKQQCVRDAGLDGHVVTVRMTEV